MTTHLTKIHILFILGAILSVSYAGFLDTDPSELIKSYVDASVDSLKPLLGRHGNHSYGQYDGVKCYEQLKYFKDEAKETKFWTLKVLDSWSKIPSGLISGNIRDLGNFDQCLAIEQNSGINNVGTFRGHYCLTLLEPIKDGSLPSDNEISQLVMTTGGQMVPYIATCIPDTCSPDAWEDVVNSLMNKYHVKVALHLHNFCHNKQEKLPMTNLDIIAFIFFTTIIILMIASTYAEYRFINSGVDPSASILTIFSVYKNGKEIFKLENEKPNTVECINGLRTFSICWIALAHSYVALVKQPMINPILTTEWIKSMFANFTIQANFAVDTFFVIGGFVLCWNRLRDLNKSNGRINFLFLIVKRYFNLMVPLMISILFLITVTKYLGYGPLYKDLFADRIELCEKFWLNTMLLIQNYTNCCTEETWYVAVDFHLFCISIFLIYGIWKFGNKFTLTFILPVVFSTCLQFYTVVDNDFEPTNLSDVRLYRYLKIIYKATHMRLGSYFIGVLLAVFMYNNRDRKFNWSKWQILCMWLLSNAAFWISYFCVNHSIHNPEGVYKFATLNATLRLLWALNIAWIIFACHHGKGGIINHFLSHKIWQPMARLSYYIYITHGYVILYFNAKAQTPMYFDDLFMVRRYFGDLIVSIIVSTIWCLAFGSPINNLFDYIAKSQRKVAKQSIENGCSVELEKKS